VCYEVSCESVYKTCSPLKYCMLNKSPNPSCWPTGYKYSATARSSSRRLRSTCLAADFLEKGLFCFFVLELVLSVPVMWNSLAGKVPCTSTVSRV
jgi:hypothetical protein